MTERTFYPDYSPSLERFKAHIRMVSNDLDGDLELKLKAAILHAEHYIGAKIALSKFVETIPFASTIQLEGPVIAVLSAKVDGALVNPSLYSLSGRVITFDNSVSGESLELTYNAGFTTVPEDIEAAILLHATSLFMRPDDSVETLAKASDNLLRPYRTYGIK